MSREDLKSISEQCIFINIAEKSQGNQYENFPIETFDLGYCQQINESFNIHELLEYHRTELLPNLTDLWYNL